MQPKFSLLKEETFLLLEGSDNRTFLQGQSTCDIRLLTPEVSLNGLLCTPKGRTIVDFLLIHVTEHKIAMRLKKELCETTKSILHKYSIFSKVEITNNNNWQIGGCWGKNAKEVMQTFTGMQFNGKCSTVSNESFKAIQIDDSGEHFECIFFSNEGTKNITALSSICQEGTQEEWNNELVNLGISRLHLETSEQHVPQVLNYDLTNFISFDKGCYTGQEIIARLKYRGKPKRRCAVATCEVSEQIDPGVQIYCADSNLAVGVVINTSTRHDRKIAVLISVTESGMQKEIYILNPKGPKLTLGELPYKVTF